MSVNRVTLVGNVGQNPEIRSTQQGSKIANFSLATTDKWKDKTTNEWKQKSEWHKIVVCNENIANLVEKYVVKGSKLYIEGSLQTKKWQDKDKKDCYTTEIILQGYQCKLELLSEKKDVNESDNNETIETENNANFDDVPF